jgi:trigger factor
MTEIKKLPKSQIKFEITVAWENWKKYLDQAVKEASEELKIPGFRPGHAPKNLVEQKVGIGALLNNATEKAVEKSYVDFVEKEKLEVIGSPKVEVASVKENEDLKYSVEVAVMPGIEIKDGYKKEIKKINEEYLKKDKTISEKDVDLELEKLANSRVKLVTVMRSAKSGDSVEVDFEVLLEGAPIENGSSKKHPLVLGKGVFIPGFEENIIGMKEGEEKEFTLNFPEEYHKKELAGKPATFKVKLGLVQERQTPEINDDFAVSLGKLENLSALKKNIREGMEHENEHRLKDEKRGKYVEKIIENSISDLPEVMIHEELHSMIHEFENQISGTGMKLDEYLSKIGKKLEDLEKEWEPQAQKRILSGLALKKIASDENIEVPSEEVESEMNKTLQYYKSVKDFQKNIDMERMYNYSKGIIENEKVFEMLEKL